MDRSKKPSTYAITRVNMGDRPSSAIAQTVLRKTAEAAMQEYPEAANIVLRNSYMDDIPASVAQEGEAIKIMKDIEYILDQRGFQMKEWIWYGSKPATYSRVPGQDQKAVQLLLNVTEEKSTAEKVLGMNWDVING